MGNILKEEKILQAIGKHPNIIQIKYKYESPEDKYVYYVMDDLKMNLFDALDDQDFRNKIKNKSKGFFTIINIINKLIDVVQYIHSKGYTHNGLSGTNVLIDNLSSVTVIDFNSAMTSTSKILRKLDYENIAAIAMNIIFVANGLDEEVWMLMNENEFNEILKVHRQLNKYDPVNVVKRIFKLINEIPDDIGTVNCNEENPVTEALNTMNIQDFFEFFKSYGQELEDEGEEGEEGEKEMSSE